MADRFFEGTRYNEMDLQVIFYVQLYTFKQTFTASFDGFYSLCFARNKPGSEPFPPPIRFHYLVDI